MLKKKLLTDRSGNLQEQILEEKAKELADEMDAEVLRGMLCELGWHQVVIAPVTWETGDRIDLWVTKTIKGRHWNRGLVWLFEDDKDAMWFKMRWMSNE